MRHRRLREKLGVKSQHRKALLRNLVRSLVLHHRIRTTVTKAKAASSFADRMVSLAKRGDLHARRLLVSELGCPDTADTLLMRIAPRFGARQGGYTRVLRLSGIRPGDASQMAILEFTEIIEAPKKSKKEKKKAGPEKKAVLEEPPKKKEPSAEEKPEKKKKAAEEELPPDQKKESEKKGGFLSRLRKFLKGDEE